jgi:transposase
MENVFPCCAGLDVHKESVEACVRCVEPNGRLDQQTQHWGTMTRDLLAMADASGRCPQAPRRRRSSRRVR